MVIKKIMVATGGSPWSEEAVNYAIELTKLLKAKLYIVTVVQYPSLLKDVGIAAPVKEELRKKGEEILENAGSKAQKEGIEFELILKEGYPEEEVVLASIEKGVDLLVIGSRAKKGILRESIGVIANKIVATAPCPVVVVKDSAFIAELLRKSLSGR